MVSTSRYWTLVQVKPSGGCITQEIAAAKFFFYQNFPELEAQKTVELSQDKFIQNRLVELFNQTTKKSAERLWAESCLRCYISHQILQVCIDLQSNFGDHHGFFLNDLVGIVLDDSDLNRTILGNPRQAGYQPFAAKILQTFDPKSGSLSTWSGMLTRQHNDLNDFLLSHGVFLQSNWSLLNETEPDELQRILSNTFHLSAFDIDRACQLLSSYHAVYRRDRRGQRGRCKPPTDDQLHRIQQRSTLPLAPKEIIGQLVKLADYLRQYRLLSRGGVLPSVSMHDPDIGPTVEQAISHSEAEDPDAEIQRQFLAAITHWLDQAIQEAIEQRRCHLQTTSPAKAHIYVAVLKAYCCGQQPMTAIASDVGLKAQYQVTRLLQMDSFLANIRRKLLKKIKDNMASFIQAQGLEDDYVCPERLQHLDEKILAQLITKPRSNANSVSLASSLFIQRLCLIIQQLE